jgi:hypothetical protein
MSSHENLSPQAQKIIELTGGEDVGFHRDVDVASVLQAHPELISGLNEYTQWYGRQLEMIARQDVAQPIGHGASEALKGISLPKK